MLKGLGRGPVPSVNNILMSIQNYSSIQIGCRNIPIFHVLAFT